MSEDRPDLPDINNVAAGKRQRFFADDRYRVTLTDHLDGPWAGRYIISLADMHKSPEDFAFLEGMRPAPSSSIDEMFMEAVDYLTLPRSGYGGDDEDWAKWNHTEEHLEWLHEKKFGDMASMEAEELKMVAEEELGLGDHEIDEGLGY